MELGSSADPRPASDKPRSEKSTSQVLVWKRSNQAKNRAILLEKVQAFFKAFGRFLAGSRPGLRLALKKAGLGRRTRFMPGGQIRPGPKTSLGPGPAPAKQGQAFFRNFSIFRGRGASENFRKISKIFRSRKFFESRPQAPTRAGA